MHIDDDDDDSYAVRYFSRSLNFGCVEIKSLKRTEPFNVEFVWPVDEDSLGGSRMVVDELLADGCVGWNERL